MGHAVLLAQNCGSSSPATDSKCATLGSSSSYANGSTRRLSFFFDALALLPSLPARFGADTLASADGGDRAEASAGAPRGLLAGPT